MDFNGRKQVAGIGSALVDMISHQPEDVVDGFGNARGGMTLVDDSFIVSALGKLSHEPPLTPGGSACNTIVGVGRLGGAAKFVGKRGRDEIGERLEAALRSFGVEPTLLTSDTPTGRVLSLVTPDAQRTMFTYLGASSEILPEEVSSDLLANAAVVHLEGYLLFNPDLTLRCLEAARQAGARISLDLASFTVVESAGAMLHDLVREYVDILLANEDEGRVYTGHSDEGEMLSAMAAEVPLAALKTGPRGAVVRSANGLVVVKAAAGGRIVDTTGAGDLWASGLLYGLVEGWSMDKAGELAARCAGEVCAVDGACIPDEGYDRLRDWIAQSV